MKSTLKTFKNCKYLRNLLQLLTGQIDPKSK